MADTGIKYPTTITTESVNPEDDNDWSNPDKAGADDGVSATVLESTFDGGDLTYRLKCQNFLFDLPAGAVIDGILVEIEHRCDEYERVKDYRVQLLDANGALIGDNKADTVTLWPYVVYTIKGYGGSADTWNASPTAAMVNNANFGVVLSAEACNYNSDARVDFIRITIYYTLVLVAPTVTTQAVTDIQPTTATGNGNITDTGGENCSKRGVCWNTGGNPTVADSKSEETDSFGTGAFTRPMTGLTPGQHYYVKAYAYNSAGYGYGGQVEFTASQLLQPSAIASAEAFGALTVVPGAVSVLPTAIGSLEAFGSAKLNLKLILTGIASAEAFGTPIVTIGLTLYPTGIASVEAFGNLVIAGPLIVPGIASQEAFGSPTVTPGGVIVAPSGISSEELFGLPKLNLFVTPSGIVTSEAFGAAQLNLKLILTGIASAEALGTPTLGMFLVIRPLGIASVEAFGNPLLIVILTGGAGLRLPTTKGQVSIPSGEVSIPSKEVSI